MIKRSSQKLIVAILILTIFLCAVFSISKLIMSTNANISFLASKQKLNGWIEKNGNKFYYKNGTMLKGFQKLKNKNKTDTYYFDKNGVMQIGFLKIKNKNRTDTYYFSETDTKKDNKNVYKGAMQTGLTQIMVNGKKELYYFTTASEEKNKKIAPEGAMQTGLMKISNAWYYFNYEGKAVIDKCGKIVDGRTFCFDENGNGTNQTKTKTYNSVHKLGVIEFTTSDSKQVTELTEEINKIQNQIDSTDDALELNELKDTLEQLQTKLTKLNTPVIKISTDKKYTGVQGFTAAGDYYIAATVHKNISTNLLFYDRKNYQLVKSVIVDNKFEHTNDLTYNTKTGKVYVGMNNGKFSLKEALSLSDDGILKVEKLNTYKNLTSKIKMSGVAYDEYNNKLYTASGNTIYIYDSGLSLSKTIKKIKGIDDKNQGIGAYKGKVLALRNTGVKYSNAINPETKKVDINIASNVLHIYRINGDYLGSYILKSDLPLEIEGVSYTGEGKKFAFSFAQKEKKTDADEYEDVGGLIYEVNLNIPQ